MRAARWFSVYLTGLFCLAVASAPGEDLTWGVNAVTLSASHAVSLGAFHRLGGAPSPFAPTDCEAVCDDDALVVTFHCQEKNLSFPATSHGVDWYSQIHVPLEQDAAFPDKVDLYISPDLKKAGYYQFAVTLDGKQFGVKRQSHAAAANDDDETVAAAPLQKVAGFSATVTKSQEEWTAAIRIPWPAIGGKPARAFGLIPFRTRWRYGEVMSPVAGDFVDRPPTDLFIETYLPGGPSTAAPTECLYQLPSGTLRWQRPATLVYPDAATIADIWRMEQNLSEPTARTNLSRRIQLLQRWQDLLVLEGFNFRRLSGGIVTNDMSPWDIRASMNAALRANHIEHACQLLDHYLRSLDAVSRRWFADGSPADILAAEWQGISNVKSVETNGNICVLHCTAGSHPVDLNLSLPVEGGLRLQANAEGFFKPARLQPAEFRGKVEISQNPFRISVLTWGGKPVFEIDPRQITFRFGPDGKVLATDFRHALEADEVIYGLGEKYDRLNQNGNVLTLWGVDDWNGLTAGLANQTYKPVPVFHSSKGYSVFINSSYRLRADVGKTDPSQLRLTQHGPVFDYYIWTGAPEGMLDSYTQLTGRPLLPPRWAFEPWMGRTGRGWAHTPLHNPVAEQERVIKKFEELDIPHSAIYAEGDAADSAALNQFAAAHGLHVCSWSYSSIPLSTQSNLLRGTPPASLPMLKGSIDDYVDYSNPLAAELSRRWWAHRLGIGVAGSMVDFGDRTPEGALFYDKRRGDEMHNAYSYDYHRTVNKIFSERRGDDFILFGRAAAPGAQQWAGQFAGDHPANFTGLQGVLTGALNLCACGFSTWGSDLGGFLGWPEPGVYMRWTEFGCFSPLMRCHGRTPREPWEFGDAAVVNYKYYAWVRENLLDYIYAAARRAHETGAPMMQGMALAFPEARSLAAVDDQYMFGPDLLVAPVVTDGTSREIAFPPGRWSSLWDGQAVNGPGTIQYAAPLNIIPVFVHEGAAIPLRLNPQLELGQSLKQGVVHALLVGPPPRQNSNLSGRGEDISIALSSNGYSIEYPVGIEPDYFLLDAQDVTEVRVDGHPVAGWKTNIVSGRIAVRVKSLHPAAGNRREVDIDVAHH